MNNLTKTFEGQEIKVKTDKGQTLINLVHTAKSCGLTQAKNGVEYIRWTDKGIVNKLKIILSHDSEKEIKSEIKYILEEIENTDDRNSIYMSSWLSKRLALECHSEKAMGYKNFLVTLDEQRESGLVVQPVDQGTVLQLAQGMQMIGTVVQGMQTALINIQTVVKDSILSKDSQIDQMMELIGFRAVNTKRLSDKLKEKLNDEFGGCITASSAPYLKAKKKVFKEFDVIKWEDISVKKYNSVYAFIDGMEVNNRM